VDEIRTLAKAAKDHGFLWKIQTQGRTDYLYGSIYLGKREWMVPGPKTIAALQSSKVIALELDILDPETQAQLADPSQFGITRVPLPPPLQRRMDTLAARICASAVALAEMHPLMQLMTLTVLDARFSNLEAGYGSKMFLAGFARGAKKPIESLETPEAQMRALLAGDAQSIADAVQAGMTLFETGKRRAQTERLINAWATGNLNEFQRFEEWCDCMTTEADRAYMKGILDDRNPHLIALVV